MFTRNPSPLILNIHAEQLLLPSRSIPTDAKRSSSPVSFANSSTFLHDSKPPSAGYQSFTLAPSIFGASQFGRWVVTQSLAVFDFHDHRPTVSIDQHPSFPHEWNISILFSRKVQSSSPVLLTKTGPFIASVWYVWLNHKHILVPLKFENEPKLIPPSYS